MRWLLFGMLLALLANGLTLQSKMKDEERQRLFNEAMASLPGQVDRKTWQLTRKSLEFLIQHMPEYDLTAYGGDFLGPWALERVKKRLERFPHIPWRIFVEYVLPYASLSEPRDLTLEFVQLFTAHVSQFVTPHANLTALALLLNIKAFAYTDPPIKFVGAPPNQVNAYSAMEVVRAKNSSCTGESVFLTLGLRLAGIPARVAGVPHWKRGQVKCPVWDSGACGNHNWVEVYVGNGRWAFIDQNTDTPRLDQAWFFPELTNELDGSYFHAVYAARWNQHTTNITFPLVFDPGYQEVPAIERTSWYHNKASLKWRIPAWFNLAVQ